MIILRRIDEMTAACEVKATENLEAK